MADRWVLEAEKMLTAMEKLVPEPRTAALKKLMEPGHDKVRPGRMWKVLWLRAVGTEFDVIATVVNLKPRTVKNYLSEAAHELNLNRTELLGLVVQELIYAVEELEKRVERRPLRASASGGDANEPLVQAAALERLLDVARREYRQDLTVLSDVLAEAHVRRLRGLVSAFDDVIPPDFGPYTETEL